MDAVDEVEQGQDAGRGAPPPGSEPSPEATTDTPHPAEVELEALTRRLEALEKVKPEPPPFWRNTALIGFMGAVIATIPPSLTAIQEYFQTEREVRLSMTTYQHERTISYLDRALNPETEEAKQAQVFRFLRHLPEEDPIRRWAEEELLLVERALDQLGEQIVATEKELTQAKAEKDAQTELVAATIDKVGPTEELDSFVHAMQMQVGDKDRDIDHLERKVTRLRVRAGEVPAATISADPAQAGAEDPGRSSLWAMRVSVEPSLEDALGSVARVRAAGGQPDVYRKGSFYYLFIGRYGTKAAADREVRAARDYLGEGAVVTDVALWCGESTRRTGYTECEF